MNENINERIMQLISHLGMNKNSFSLKIGLTNGTIIGNIVSGRLNKPSFEVIYKIIKSFDDINGDWLLTGRGEMLKGTEPAPVRVIKEVKTEKCYQCEHKQEIIELQRARIESLQKLVEAKEEIITELRGNHEGNGGRQCG